MNRRHPLLVVLVFGLCLVAYGAVRDVVKDSTTNIITDLCNFSNLMYLSEPVVTAARASVFTNKTFDADGTGNSITNIENADIKSGAAIDAAKIANGQVSSTEFQYLDGVTSAIQTQIQAKAESGVNSSITSLTGLTTALSIPQGGTGETSAALALTALGGQPTSALLTSFAACAPETNDMPYFTSPTTVGKKAIVTTLDAVGYDTQIATEKAVRTALTAVALPAAGSKGRLAYDDGAAWVVFEPGTPGEYLKTLGAGQAPDWDTPAGGGDMLAAVYAPAETGVVCNTGGSFTTETYLAVNRGGTGRSCAGETGLIYNANGTFSTVGSDSIRNRWHTVAAAKYTATPASTSSVTMSDTSDMAVGSPLKYVYGGVTYYGIVTAVSANTSITLAGAALDTGTALTALYVGDPELAVQVDFFVPGTYGDGTADLLAADAKTYFRWHLGKAYLVKFSATEGTADTGAEPKVNVKVNAQAVSTNDSSLGLQLNASAGTWTDSSAIAISTTYYDINKDEAVEVSCTAAGGTGDAENLTVSCVFILE